VRKYHALSQHSACWASEATLRQWYAAEHGGKMPGARSIGRRRRALIRSGALRCVRYRKPGAWFPNHRQRTSHGFLEAISLSRWLARKAKAKAEREAKRRGRRRPPPELPQPLERVALSTIVADLASIFAPPDDDAPDG
jgi:hypothetical protein